MTESKLDPSTPNDRIGLYYFKSRRVDPLGAGLPFRIPEQATWIQCTTAGTLVWKNANEEAQISSFEAGEAKPLAAVEILAGATIDGVAETTTPTTGWFWITTPFNIGKK